VKAQSAIEYLMTYGWMLLVVAIAGGGFYSVVGSQCTQSVSGFSGEDVEVTEYGFTETDLELMVENSASSSVEIDYIEIDGQVNESDTSISVRDSDTVKVPDFIESSSCNALDVEIGYNTSSLEDLTVEGSLTGQVQSSSVDTPSITNVEQ